MRLIDRDEILNRIGAIVSKFPEEYDEKTYKMIRCEIRNKSREVDAIPIEWIERWFSQFYGEQGLEWNRCKRFMLDDWEKENDSNDTIRI